ncbi:hypothetical protein AB0I00_25445 [Streptomyces sp. NPDC050803]|uniref:hypothetical protein n=1 Tax=unclassified Streptomyces TaxID=2593676 RepID=UPI0034448937
MTDTAPAVRALTLWQPWASCIAYGTKRIENRRWATDYRGWLLIHAGRTIDPDARGVPLARPFLLRPQPSSAVLGWARLDDCHTDDGWCSLWSAPGQWHWHLTDVRPLGSPVPCPGARGLWTPNPSLLDQIREAARA